MLEGRWCKELLEIMTGGGGGGQRPGKMNMGRGAELGIGTEERPCPFSIPSATAVTDVGAPLSTNITEKPLTSREVTPLPHPPLNDVPSLNFFTQARKALSLRCPYDSDDPSSQATASGAGSTAGVPPSTILPSGLAQFLFKHSDSSRKRHKKSHSGAEHKGRPEKSRGSNIWDETEEYFRELTTEDIDKLHQDSSFGFTCSDECFKIPSLDSVGNVSRVCSLCNAGYLGNADTANAVNGRSVNGINGLEDNVDAVEKQGQVEELVPIKEENELMEVDCVEVNEVAKEQKGGEEKGVNKQKRSIPFNSLEWLLGSKKKIYLTTERPSKKRKLLGENAGLEKLLVAQPAEGSGSLCHYCSTSDMGDQLNPLISCSSCGMRVHQRCYGIQNEVDGTWLCSWCKQGTDGPIHGWPCLLCPKQGGALKPAQKKENNSSKVEYAHLFCSQWIPEVYIENIWTMEPIMNVDQIKDTRKKLICYLCKVKCGACVRCSNGACRTSFHPICAREAKHRMEIWGRLGCDEVELRAFCSKHSEVESDIMSQSVGDSLSVGLNQPATPITNKLSKIQVGGRNGDKVSVDVEMADLDMKFDNPKDSSLHEDQLLNNSLKSKLWLEHGDVQKLLDGDSTEKEISEEANVYDSMSMNVLLKKLADQGKIDLKDVATEFGVSVDSLTPVHTDNHMAPELQGKIITWLRDNGYLGNLLKTLRVKIKPTVPLKAEVYEEVDVYGNDVTAAESDILNIVPVKSVPPRRRTKSDIQVLKNDKVICTSLEMINNVTEKYGSDLTNGESCSNKDSSDGIEKNLNQNQDILPNNSNEPEAVALGISENGEESQQKSMVNPSDSGNTESPGFQCLMPDLVKSKTSGSYIHPLVCHKLFEVDTGSEYDGSRGREFSQLGASSSSGICCHQQIHQSNSTDLISKYHGADLEQLVKARNMGLLQLSPSDEVEGELIFYQQRLLANAVARRQFTDDLISSVAKSLQLEIDSARKQKWDAVLLSQYLYELREAKKQGRKERRHREAQAVLAAATAAAAASSRISSLRKDTLEESTNEDISKVNNSNGGGLYLQQNPRVKETLSRTAAAARLSSEKNSDSVSLASDFSVEHPRTCDICTRCETLLNPILVCSSCKIAVHLDCYRGVKKSAGPWYCELCEDLLSSRFSGISTTSSWEKPYFVAECGFCGGTAGAFRKSIGGQWVHAFCAEWVLESSFRRGQVNPIEGVEMVTKGGDVCVICCRKQGVCIKCNYGNCQSTFHPSCARSAGFYMSARSAGGKLQHKAYCGKHSLEQKAKADTQKHGVEEFKSLKQVRVELERLRLLCERIIKREKVKRELVLCSHEILSSKRDTVVLAALTRHPIYHPDVSSDSATTSTRGYTDGNKSGSETVQRSDDITVDSTVASKRHIKFPMSMDIDQKTDDSSVSQHVTQKPPDRVPFSGKKIPNRSALVLRNHCDDAETRSRYKKNTETFEKELVMTSDQASMKNQRLPKGFVYVPIRCLSKEKETISEASSHEPIERDG